MKNEKYYLGLDIGTDSVGYAVTNEKYDLLKKGGKPMWGVTLFDEAQLKADRRAFRTARRRLNRRQQRVDLIQQLFAGEIAKVDPRFYIRQQESALWRDEAQDKHTLFDDPGFTDKEYYKQYPTIHHLILDLMDSDRPHDVRLVYLACAWLVAHRGHFLSDISMDNVAAVTDFDSVFSALNEYVLSSTGAVSLPWKTDCADDVKEILQAKIGISAKSKKLFTVMFDNGKPPKDDPEHLFAYSADVLLKALCGSTVKAKDLFNNDAYSDIPSFSLASDDDKLAEVTDKLGDDAELISYMKAVYDWSVLVGVLSGYTAISEAKVKQYEQHQTDLKNLKAFIKKYLPVEKYREVFKEVRADNYLAYSYHISKKSAGLPKGKAKKDIFCKYLKGVVEKVEPQKKDKAFYDDMMERLALNTFLPKQKDSDNRVIPYQLYLYELNMILSKASAYLPFLAEKDADGLSNADKIKSVFTFRVPYYVGPLNPNSDYAWIVKKSTAKITPWNFDDVVDRDRSEDAFINRMVNNCTYIPGEKVVPKESLLYHRFTVLNEINNITVNETPISVEQKQDLYRLFEEHRKVTPKMIRVCLNLSKDDMLGGIDVQIKSDLKPYHDFAVLMKNGILSEEQVETIIERITYTEDKSRLKRWLKKNFSGVNDKNIEYIVRLNYKDFGRLSAYFLREFEGINKETGEVTSIMRELWDTNNNLMKLLSEMYSFAEEIDKRKKDYYAANPVTLDERMDEMRLSNAVKRPVLRALEITREVVKATGHAPEKIFVEVTRGASDEQKNKRTQSRKEQLIELYKKCDQEDVRLLSQQLEEMGETADNRLRSDALFLYYIQLGKCLYTGKTIDVSKIKGNEYNIEHIYPQSRVKDDSVINNKILVYSEANGDKGDTYPVDASIQKKMRPFWNILHDNGMMSDEKYHRLTRTTPFTEEEKLAFINRQLTETSQSVKAVATLLKEKYPDTQIVYTKARLTSEFRQEFDLLKSRIYNDLHHAKDAYLNIVTGNVYTMRFSAKWFNPNREEYTLNTRPLFTNSVICSGKTVWDGIPMLEKVKKTVVRDDAHMTKYAFCRYGGFFDQMPLKAADGLIPLKAGKDTSKYGGYNKPTISFFSLVKFRIGKKTDIMVMGVELLHYKQFLAGEEQAADCAKKHIGEILGKTVDEVSFPMGLRILKINTVFSLDGFKVCLAGGGSGGKAIIAAPLVSFHADAKWQTYLKRLEKLVENLKRNPHYIFDPVFDKVTKEENENLYDIYMDKLQHSIYSMRVNNPVTTIVGGKKRFSALSETNQARALVNIHSVFGRLSSGCDLTLVGGVARAAATVSFSAFISNWKKNYKSVSLIDTSATGIWEKQTENLFELL